VLTQLFLEILLLHGEPENARKYRALEVFNVLYLQNRESYRLYRPFCTPPLVTLSKEIVGFLGIFLVQAKTLQECVPYFFKCAFI
jgi:hypothetical protein